MDDRAVKVLLVDDDEDDYIITRDLFDEIEEEKFHLEWVQTYDEALKEIRRCQHDVYLLDYRLGDRTGLELLQETDANGSPVPMILLTGQDDRETDLKAMNAGASDYLVKGEIDPHLLERSIRYAIGRKQAEIALARAKEELEIRVEERTSQLREKAQQLEQTLRELQRAQIQLVQSEKMSGLGQLMAGVAHEINNPVNFITGNLSHASEYISDLLHLLELYQQHYREPVDEIRSETEAIDLEFLMQDLPKLFASMKLGADRISEIVRSLRNFSRLDQSEMKPVDVHEGIDSTLLILQNRIKAKPDRPAIEVIKKYGQLPEVECYAGQLNQVFMNVLTNAIDALETQPPPHAITICTEVGKGEWGMGHGTDKKASNSRNNNQLSISHSPFPIANPQFVVIRISDNGPGMTAEVRQRLFDPFFTTKPPGKGTGLGMAICYEIVVEKHGAQLKCFSEPGKGSEFWIELPISQSAAAAQRSPTRKNTDTRIHANHPACPR